MDHRRVDPTQIARNRKQIAQQQQDIQDYGHTDPSLLERLGNLVSTVRKRRAAEKNPPPVLNGAMVTGFKNPNTET